MYISLTINRIKIRFVNGKLLIDTLYDGYSFQPQNRCLFDYVSHRLWVKKAYFEVSMQEIVDSMPF
jgi:hypothetical protein